MAIPLSQRLRIKPVPNTEEERGRRLAICAECEWARLNVTGWCKSCKRPFHGRIETDDELVCRCGGEIRVAKEFAQCGHCGCPLSSRTKYHSFPGHGPIHCPLGPKEKW